MQNVLCNLAIKNGSFDHIGRNLDTINAVSTDITGHIDKLAQVDKAILHRNKANQMGPIWHFERDS
jgi:hypothetical protein